VVGRDLFSIAEALDRIMAELGVTGVFEIHLVTRDLFQKWHMKIDILIPPRCRDIED